MQRHRLCIGIHLHKAVGVVSRNFFGGVSHSTGRGDSRPCTASGTLVLLITCLCNHPVSKCFEPDLRHSLGDNVECDVLCTGDMS